MLPSQGLSLALESRVRRKKSSIWNIDFDSDSEEARDSGYGSAIDKDEERYREEEARVLEEKMGQYEQEGPTMSNLCAETIARMEREWQKWQE